MRKTYHFRLVLTGSPEDNVADRLGGAGCDDATLGTGDGRAWVRFARQAESLEFAMRSALADLQSAGIAVDYAAVDAADLEAMD